MSDLIERLKNAKRADREFNVAIHAAAYPDDYQRRYWNCLAMQNKDDPKAEENARLRVSVPDYTGSLDDAMSLFGEAIPRGLNLSRRSDPDMGGYDWIVSCQSPTRRAVARSWPLAICMVAISGD